MLLPREFVRPPREFAPWPFWFLNDRLDLAEIRRQAGEFADHGVGGLVLHPRLGLPRDQGWMSESLLDAMEAAIEVCAARGVKVVLYDEGMYPSGSAAGRVVEENPALAARGIARRDAAFTPLPGETVLARDGDTLIVERPVNSAIRGLHYLDELSAAEENPPAANLLDPEAVRAFLRHSYERYAGRFARWLRDPIVGIFTDEPTPLSRCAEPDVLPWTPGLIPNEDLPRLWTDDAFRRDYRSRVNDRLVEVYYRPVREWCERHGLWLMGHPEGPADASAMRTMHVPGQDMVWRWVEPWEESAVDGPQSTQAKAAASVARHIGAPRCSNEFGGAYGDDLTFDQFRSLAWWLIVRGVDLLIPHAFFYSQRGPRRKERPPDVGPNSAWWDRWPEFASQCARLCWINTGEPEVEVAVLGGEHDAPWSRARWLMENQIDFHYVAPSDLQNASIGVGSFVVGPHRYSALFSDGNASLVPRRFRDAGLVATSVPRLSPFVSAPRSLRVRKVLKNGWEWLIAFQEAGHSAVADLESGWFEVGLESGEILDEAGGPTPFDPLEIRLFARPS